MSILRYHNFAHYPEVLLLYTVSSFSKEAKCDLCPDTTWRPPGLLRGCSTLPPAPHLDGQSDCGLRQCHVSVGKTETTMPKHTAKWRLLHRRKSLKLCISVTLALHPLTISNPRCTSAEKIPDINVKLLFLLCLLLWCYPTFLSHFSHSHPAMPSPQFPLCPLHTGIWKWACSDHVNPHCSVKGVKLFHLWDAVK